MSRRFVWYQIKKVADLLGGAESAELAGKKKPGKTFEQFVESFQNLDAREKQAFLEKTKNWDRDFTGYAVQKFRKADQSNEEMEEDPDKRHILLSSLYLERVKGKPNVFRANFHGNYTAEYKAIGWGHTLPGTAHEIKVKNQLGEVLCERAVRGTNPANGREGYFEAGGLEQSPPQYRYVYMYTGYTAEVLKTVSPGEAEINRKKSREQNVTVQRQKRTRETFGQMAVGGVSATALIDRRLEALGNRSEELMQPLEATEVREGRTRLVSIARSYAGTNRFDADFRSVEMLKGGKLGCAWVASTILRDAGYLDAVIPGVDGVASALQAKGWTVSHEKPEPGDVVIWERLPGRTMALDDGSEAWMPGHKHIGIMTGPNMVVDNDSNTGRPQQRALFRPGRGIEAILKPPSGAVTAPHLAKTMPGRPAKKTPEHYVPTAEKPTALPEGKILNRMTKDPRAIAEDHRQNLNQLEIRPEKSKELKRFVEKTLANRARYERVSNATGIPWELIALIHYREAGQDFTRYLHNGEKLGKPTKFVPEGILFREDQWEEAAIHALGGDVTDNNGKPSLKTFRALRDRVGLSGDSKDFGAEMAFAEFYNGLGYRNKGKTSPYVYAGTNLDQGGMFVADRVFDPNKKDPRVGAAAMLLALNEAEGGPPLTKKGEALA